MFIRLVVKTVLLLVLLAGTSLAESLPRLDLGSAPYTGSPTVTIPMTLTNVPGTSIYSVSTEILYDPAILGSPTIAIGTAPTVGPFMAANRAVVSPGDVQVSVMLDIYNPNFDPAQAVPLNDGVVAYVTFTVLTPPTVNVVLTNIRARGSSKLGDRITVTGSNGSITVPTLMLSQTISFGTPPTLVYGSTAGTLSATASSGLPVTFSSKTTGICTVSGNAVTPAAAGNCVVAANQAGNSEYLPAPEVTQEIVVAKAEQAITGITFTPPTLSVGGTTTVSATGGASGNAIVFSSATATVCSVSGSNGSTVTALSGGTCTIAANQAGNDNYAAAPQVTRDITVGATIPGAPTSVRAEPGDGQALVSFTAPSDGGSAITLYTVTSSPGGSIGTGTASPITVMGLTNGSPYTFTVTATNAIGKGPASAPSTPVTPATGTAPTVTISTLPDGAVTRDATLNITGSATSGNGIKSVTINGTAVSVNPDGSFSTAITLAEGPNAITIIATDTVDKQTTVARTIILDTTAPALIISAPTDNAVTAQMSVTITGTISDANMGAVTATVDTAAPASAAITGSNFSVTVNLASGTNTIVIVATDLAGNTNSAKRTIVVDDVKPQLAVTVPAQDLTIHNGTYLLKGTLTDSTATTITITAAGKTYNPTVTDGNFEQELTFSAEGTFAVIVVARDAAGNTSTVQRNFIYTMNKTGDINGDYTVDVADALLALQIAIGNITATPAQLSRGDVAPLISGAPQPDGTIDVGDALLILMKCVNLINW